MRTANLEFLIPLGFLVIVDILNDKIGIHMGYSYPGYIIRISSTDECSPLFVLVSEFVPIILKKN